MAILWLLFEYSGIVYKIMGILNLPRTSHGHAHEQRGKGHGCPQQAHALHHYQVLQIKYHILHDIIDSKHFYSTHPSSATRCTS